MTERALRTLVQVVVMKDAVLEDADRGARGCKRDDDRHHHRRSCAGRETVHKRDHQKQHHLLAGKQADARFRRARRRNERDGSVGDERPEKLRQGEAFPLEDDEHEPAGDCHGQQNLRRRNRELQRADHAKERDRPDLFETATAIQERGVDSVWHGVWHQKYILFRVRLKADIMILGPWSFGLGSWSVPGPWRPWSVVLGRAWSLVPVAVIKVLAATKVLAAKDKGRRTTKDQRTD